MNTDFEIIEKEIGNVIEIEENEATWKLPSIMKKDYKKIFEYLKSQNTECSDAPYAHYLDVDWDAQINKSTFSNFLDIFTKKWHFWAGVPTSLKLDGEENLKSREIGKRRYAKAIHLGPYQKVGKTYENMYKWIKEQGLTEKNESFEFYLNDPRNTKKELLETLVLIPIE